MDHLSDCDQHPVYSSEQARQLDSVAIEKFGIKGYDLMQRAGKAALTLIQQQYPSAKNILVITGGGNNGGDGYIVARLAAKSGIDCTVMPIVPVTKLRGDAARAQNDFAIHDGYDVDLSTNLPDCDLIVDAIFGTGLSRPVDGIFADLIQSINRTPAPVVSLDIPSGLNATSGNPMGPTVYANTTITFIGLKTGLLTGQARNYTGNIVLDSLNLPSEVTNEVTELGSTIADSIRTRLLPVRKASSYKNNFGHVLVVGGNRGYPNAARLAAEAAARTGAGLVSVATHPDSISAIAGGCASLMVKGIRDARGLGPLLKKANVVVIGPGLGQDSWAQKIFARVMETDLPLIIDADALHLLAGEGGVNNHWILTPHPGEAAQLLASNASDIEADRVAAILALHEKFNGVTVLKGAGTLTCYEQYLGFCTRGNASLATGGTGDVLSGIIAGLVAQDISLFEATNCGVLLHALAGESVSTQGTRGVLASDLLPALYPLVNPCHVA